jgi:hypothetical protein
MQDSHSQGKPLPRLNDPDFKYIRAKDTDLRATFRRLRLEQQQQLELPLDYPPVDQKTPA